jgi:hypothetical protein
MGDLVISLCRFRNGNIESGRKPCGNGAGITLNNVRGFWKTSTASFAYPCMISELATTVRQFQQLLTRVSSLSKIRTTGVP